jgi:hypothetical protein
VKIDPGTHKGMHSVLTLKLGVTLIILDSMGIDIILGMDWLKKYDGVIPCAKRAVRLTTGHGTKVEFSTVMTTDPTSMLN